MDRALRSLFVFDGPVYGLDRGLHLQEPFAGPFGLAALIGTSEHFNRRSALLDQSPRAFLRLSVCSSLIIASHGPSLGRLSGATIAYHVVDKLMIVPKSVVSQFEFFGRSRMDRIGA